MNRIERFLKRQTVESLERKMKEWQTNNFITFFECIFGELTVIEMEYLIFKFPYLVKSEEYSYIY